MIRKNRRKATEMDNDIKTDKEPEAPAAEAEEKKPGEGPENTEETEAGATEEIGKKERKHLKKKISELESKLEAAEAEAAKCKAAAAEKDDNYLRLLAEFDNYKKRTAKEAESRYSAAYEDAVEALLPVFDNIERAAEYASDESSKNGLMLIISNFKDILAKMGVEQFGAPGEEFDPAIHNAAMHVEDEELGENVLAEVFLKGYKKGDKIIRHATVKVAN